MAYAENTKVTVSKTKSEIEEIVQRAGANQFVSGYKGNLAVIGFTMANRQIRFLLQLPDVEQYGYTPGKRLKRTEEQKYSAWEQACRSRWRALYLIIKAKLEAVESGISTIEREFFYDIVLPNGQTVGEWAAPQIETAYDVGKMPDMLPMLPDNLM